MASRIAFLVCVSLLVPAASFAAGGALETRWGGQIRAQAETTNVESFASPGTGRAKDSLGLRTRLQLEAKPGEGLKVFAQLQDSRTAGQETSVASNDNLVDLHQGYLEMSELFGRPVDLTAGRMELSYGAQRLVSPLDWSLVGRAWDGVRLRGRFGSSTADLFVTEVKEAASLRRDQVFWGLYASCRALPGRTFDAYVLGRDFGNDSVVSEVRADKGNLSDRTLGVRGAGKEGPFDWSGEADWQVGRRAGMPVRAWAAALTGGWSPTAVSGSRLGLEYDFASGDKNPLDDRVHGFDPLFPFGHSYQGFQDLFSWKNGHTLKVSGSAAGPAGMTVELDYLHFWLAQAKDAWYNAATAAIARDPAGGSGRDVGHELDLHAKMTVRGALKLWFGASRFFAGGYAKTRGARDRNWAFLQATIDF